jgi:hypothetical protein
MESASVFAKTAVDTRVDCEGKMKKCNPLQSEKITGKQQADSRRSKPETD